MTDERQERQEKGSESSETHRSASHISVHAVQLLMQRVLPVLQSFLTAPCGHFSMHDLQPMHFGGNSVTSFSHDREFCGARSIARNELPCAGRQVW